MAKRNGRQLCGPGSTSREEDAPPPVAGSLIATPPPTLPVLPDSAARQLAGGQSKWRIACGLESSDLFLSGFVQQRPKTGGEIRLEPTEHEILKRAENLARLLLALQGPPVVQYQQHHHHHHHHHGRQLSTSDCCISPSQQQQPQPQQPPQSASAVPTLTLEDVSLFRVADFRLLFLARCCQLHALSGKRHVVLSAQALETLHDVLRVILREANNDGDFLAVRMVYALSGMVASYVGNGGQHLQSARAALRRHEAWSNPELYKAALEDCVARDKQQWLGLQSPLLQLVGSSEGGGGGSEAIIRLLLLLRLRAIAEAIVQLRCPTVTQPGEDEALVQGLLNRCREAHGQSFALAEVYAPPAPSVMLWLLDAATRILLLHEESTEGDGTWHFHRGLRGATTTTAAGASSIPNVLRWASERAMAASHWPCLGFSAHHALLLFVATHAERLAKAGPVLLNRPPPPAASGVTGDGGGMCLCGKPSYAEWRVLGGYGLMGGAAERIRELAPSLLCEPCFRTLLREYPLLQQHHRPPQAVGCAPLPAAATVHTPRSLAALAAAATDIMHPSEVMVERQPSPPPRPLSTTTTVVLGLTTSEPNHPWPRPLLFQPAPAALASAAAAAVVEETQPAVPATPPASSSKVSPSKTSATTPSNAPSPRPPSRKISNSVSSSGQRLVKEGDAALRRRGVSGSGSREGAAAASPPPPPPRPQSTRERGSSSHLGASGSGSGSGAGVSGRPRLRKSELMALLMSGELEVLKHVRGPFGGAPHRRILFVDDASTESASLQWCDGKKGAKTLKKGGGLPLKHLQDVRRKGRVVTMLFKERPLVVEAYTEERAELIEAVFMYVFNKNRKMTTLMAATSAPAPASTKK